MIKKKRGQNVKDADTQRAIDEIYIHLNELIESINSMASEADPRQKGKTGDIRVVKDSEKDSKLQVRTTDGWSDLIYEGGLTWNTLKVKVIKTRVI